jgi:hypothetical protein
LSGSRAWAGAAIIAEAAQRKRSHGLTRRFWTRPRRKGKGTGRRFAGRTRRVEESDEWVERGGERLGSANDGRLGETVKKRRRIEEELAAPPDGAADMGENLDLARVGFSSHKCGRLFLDSDGEAVSFHGPA